MDFNKLKKVPPTFIWNHMSIWNSRVSIFITVTPLSLGLKSLACNFLQPKKGLNQGCDWGMKRCGEKCVDRHTPCQGQAQQLIDSFLPFSIAKYLSIFDTIFEFKR